MLKFTIYGEPIPKQSDRNRNGGWHYQSNKVVEREEYIRHEIARQYHENYSSVKSLIYEPIIAEYDFYFSLPKNLKSKVKKNKDNYLKPTRPDSGNLIKLLEDAMEGLVYVDDAQICVTTVCKFYTEGSPRIEVSIKKAPPESYIEIVKDKKQKQFKNPKGRNPQEKYRKLFDFLVTSCAKYFDVPPEDIISRRYLRVYYIKSYITKILKEEGCTYMDIGVLFRENDHTSASRRHKLLNVDLQTYELIRRDYLIVEEMKNEFIQD